MACWPAAAAAASAAPGPGPFRGRAVDSASHLAVEAPDASVVSPAEAPSYESGIGAVANVQPLVHGSIPVEIQHDIVLPGRILSR